MVLVALAMCALGAVLGAVGIVYPEVLVGGTRAVFETPTGLYAAAGTRLFFGVALFFAALTSRAPRTLRVLGAIAIVTALIMPIVGVEGFRWRVEWVSALDPGFLRTYAVFVLGFSALLAYALVPRSRAAYPGAGSCRGTARSNRSLVAFWHQPWVPQRLSAALSSGAERLVRQVAARLRQLAHIPRGQVNDRSC